jgi:hypothetical protein
LRFSISIPIETSVTILKFKCRNFKKKGGVFLLKITVEDNGIKHVYSCNEYFLMIDEVNAPVKKGYSTLSYHSNINQEILLTKLYPFVNAVTSSMGIE